MSNDEFLQSSPARLKLLVVSFRESFGRLLSQKASSKATAEECYRKSEQKFSSATQSLDVTQQRLSETERKIKELESKLEVGTFEPP